MIELASTFGVGARLAHFVHRYQLNSVPRLIEEDRQVCIEPSVMIADSMLERRRPTHSLHFDLRLAPFM